MVLSPSTGVFFSGVSSETPEGVARGEIPTNPPRHTRPTVSVSCMNRHPHRLGHLSGRQGRVSARVISETTSDSPVVLPSIRVGSSTRDPERLCFRTKTGSSAVDSLKVTLSSDFNHVQLLFVRFLLSGEFDGRTLRQVRESESRPKVHLCFSFFRVSGVTGNSESVRCHRSRPGPSCLIAVGDNLGKSTSVTRFPKYL